MLHKHSIIKNKKNKTSKIDIFEVLRGTDRIRTGDDGVADRSLTAWLPRHMML